MMDKKQCLELATVMVEIDGKILKVCPAHLKKLAPKQTDDELVQGYQQCEVME